MKFVALISVLIAIVFVFSYYSTSINAQSASYSVSITNYPQKPVISQPLLDNSVFPYSYNSAAFRSIGQNPQTCLLVRCQNKTSGEHALGKVTASQIALSCENKQQQSSSFTPITLPSVVFKPQPGERDLLGTEDPRALVVNNTLFMFFTSVQHTPTKTCGVSARLSLATCDLSTTKQGVPTSACWKDLGPLFPDPSKTFGQFTKSGALLYDETKSEQYLIFGDSTIINGLQVAVTVDLYHYKILTDFLLITPREHMFDSELVEAGPPPLKLPGTKNLWFFIYNSAQRIHGVPNSLFYNPGWLILDTSNGVPTVVVRSSEPLMMPSHHWQTEGLTPYVVFVEGMVPTTTTSTKISPDAKLSQRQRSASSKFGETSASFDIFYGAADTNVGVATVTVTY